MKVLRKISILTAALMLAIFIAAPAMAATIFVPNDYPTIGAAVTAAGDGDTIRVTEGTTEPAQIVVDTSLTVIGEGRPVIKAGFDTGSVDDARAWWLVTSNGNLELENLVLDGDSGSGRKVFQAIRAHGPGKLNNCEIKNVKWDNARGFGISTPESNWTITNNVFRNIQRVGIHLQPLTAGTITNTVVANNIYYGKGAGVHLDYAIEVGGGAVATITDNIITDCKGIYNADDYSAGIYVENYFNTSAVSKAILSGNIITGNYRGISVGYMAESYGEISEADAHYNQIFGNDLNIENTSSATLNFQNNWWGTADTVAIAATITNTTGSVDASSPLQAPQGAQGPQGIQGETGADGAVGAAGPQGPQGDKGDTGDVGPIGPQGIQGVAGPAGPAGADGATGATGPQGPQGDPGTAGTSSWTDGTGIVTTSQNVGMGTANPLSSLHLVSNSTSGSRGLMSAQHNDGPQAGVIILRKSRGTEGSPTGLLNGDYIATIHAQGHDGTSYLSNTSTGSLAFLVDGAVTTGSLPTALSFATGTTVSNKVERFRVTSSGNVGIGTSTPSQKLEVNGNVKATAFYGDGTNLTGIIGTPGPEGPQGPQGIQGETGPIGPQGPAGADGVTGPQGPQGIQGETGPIGPQGSAGADGTAGADGKTILSGTVDPTTDGVDGYFYINTAANTIFGPKTGGAWPAGVSLVGPAGADGAQGPQGDQGPQGSAGADGAVGATGPQGIQGETGADGAVGAAGPQGPQGDKGDTGDVGPIGPQGIQGVAGPAGPAGADGATGATGPQGPQGDPGTAGTSSWTDGTGIVTTSQNVGMGTANPLSSLHLVSNSTSGSRGLMSAQHNDGPQAGVIILRKSRGTEGSPTGLLNGDYIATIHAQGHDGTSYLSNTSTGSLAFLVDGAVTTGSLPTALSFATGTTVSNKVERFRVTSSGNVGIGTSTPSQKLEVNGNVSFGGGSANHAVCWKADGKTLGYCSTAIAADGSCTCN